MYVIYELVSSKDSINARRALDVALYIFPTHIDHQILVFIEDARSRFYLQVDTLHIRGYQTKHTRVEYIVLWAGICCI